MIRHDQVSGVDYIWTRADWSIGLDIRATVETESGIGLLYLVMA
jgi:hypothetical protein